MLQIPPQVDIGEHTIAVHVRPHEGDIKVELRHPDVGGRTYRVMNEAVVADAAGALGWIRLVAPAIKQRLDAEVRFAQRQRGYRA